MPTRRIDRRRFVSVLADIGAAGSMMCLARPAEAQAVPPTPRNLRIVNEQEPPATLETAAWNRTNGPPLDLSGYSLAWSDEFDRRQILAGNQSGSAQWYAGAQGGPYGAASVGYSPRDDVYIVEDGILTIRAHAYTNARGQRTGDWYSGHLQTINTKGEGFALQEGYFEARMKFPSSMGAWPAFWLKHRNKWLVPNSQNIEIDVVEWYGGDWYGHHHTIHIGEGATRKFWGDYENVKDGDGKPVDLSHDWHTHGALITRDWIVIYLDRLEIGRFPMLEPLRTPLYPQLTLSILKQPDTGVVSPQAISPMDLHVDYVRVYAPNRK
jgi:beta-glucanase (GH16 family)